LTLTLSGIKMRTVRTTLTLDPDVARLLDEAVHRERRPMKHVVNEALRRALAPEVTREPVRLVPHESAVRPGIDLGRLNQLADELEDESVVDRAHGSA
jgi:predicted transcriptional regulator